MYDKRLSSETVMELLDFESFEDFNSFMIQMGKLAPSSSGDVIVLTPKEVLALKLASVLLSVGVNKSKAYNYAETVLFTYFSKQWTELQKLIEDGNQELFCLIEDSQLARIFLRAKDDGREFEVGAVKPVLLPTTRCEVNVNRAIRPVVYRALK